MVFVVSCVTNFANTHTQVECIHFRFPLAIKMRIRMAPKCMPHKGTHKDDICVSVSVVVCTGKLIDDLGNLLQGV